MKNCLVVASVLLLIQGASVGVFAKALGTIGHTYPVMEKSLLTLIEERLSNFENQGTLQDIESAWVKHVEEKAIRPTPLTLSRTDKTTTHYYTPVATLPADLADAAGRIILKRGVSVNALNQMPAYQPVWVFINYDDSAQRKYAARLLPKFPSAQWILTGGNVRDAENQLKQAIYFDQGGHITQKLQIQHVPALVTRENDSLKVVESAIGEDGYAF